MAKKKEVETEVDVSTMEEVVPEMETPVEEVAVEDVSIPPDLTPEELAALEEMEDANFDEKDGVTSIAPESLQDFKDDEEIILEDDSSEEMKDTENEVADEDIDLEEIETEATENGEEVNVEKENVPVADAVPQVRRRKSILPEELEMQDQVVMAGKRKQRKIYHQDVVLTSSGERRVARQNTQRHKDYINLAASAKEKTILSGTLVSQRTTPNDNIVLAEVAYGEYFTVNIPAYLLVDMSMQPPIKDNMDMETVYKDIINKRIGSEIEFIVLSVDEAKGIAYGSHVDAMVRRARSNYTRPTRDGVPRCVKGMLVDAQIMQVNTIGMWVEALGAETFITQSEISWFRQGDISEEYHVGQSVTVRILDIQPHQIIAGERKINTVKIAASIKQSTEDPNIKYYNNYNIGSTGQGKVTQVTATGIFVIFANKISVRCRLYDGIKQPAPGSIVLVKITNKHDQDHRFDGRIQYIIQDAGM